jgi:hypothetical protein
VRINAARVGKSLTIFLANPVPLPVHWMNRQKASANSAKSSNQERGAAPSLQ